MSRYESKTDKRIQPADPNFEVSVGWDPPMRTFFFQVHDTSVQQQMDEEMDAYDNYVENGGDPDDYAFTFRDGDELVEWQGADFDEIKLLTELTQKLEPYATLSRELLVELAKDSGAI